jgi:hypothetical protein
MLVMFKRFYTSSKFHTLATLLNIIIHCCDWSSQWVISLTALDKLAAHDSAALVVYRPYKSMQLREVRGKGWLTNEHLSLVRRNGREKQPKREK